DAPDPVDSRVWVRAGRPVISLRTFSKMYGLAGLRLGYGVADPALVRYLHQVREPFNANAVAQAAAAAALGDAEHVQRVRAVNSAGKEQYYRGLEALGAPAVRSQANFVLARVGDGERVFNALLRHGVIVRAGFPTLEAFVRISVGTERENTRCLKALEEVLADVSAAGARTQ
ncbi:MAG: aminotransferase class I/II-fold pyridoxal phosphate-dependent enzyme, partial [Firmicutes bacterium]|nr:aminotransferase class I/II-fold pyridoxal phosphate-dependent enzyme [Bacillota bacterium]